MCPALVKGKSWGEISTSCYVWIFSIDQLYEELKTNALCDCEGNRKIIGLLSGKSSIGCGIYFDE